MKILVTGITGRMCGNERLKDPSKLMYGRMQAVMYADELDAMGHDVTHCKVEWDEDLSDFDVILLGVAPLSSLSASNFEMVGRILRCYDDKVCLFVEDWSVENLTRDWVGKLSEEAWRKHLKWKGYENTDQPAFDEIRRGLLTVVNGLRCPYPVLCSMFPWGDHNALLGESYECVAVDVSPLIEYPQLGEIQSEARRKDRCWVLGALSDQSRWVEKQRFGWPVLQYGHKSSGQPRLQERELVQRYADNWGVLCPPYKKSGTGWWRNRYNWSALVGSILYCDRADGLTMDESYGVGLPYIESASDADLRYAAECQRDWFLGSIWTREQFRDSMATLLARWSARG